MCDFLEKNEFSIKILVDKAKDLKKNWFYNIKNEKNKLFLKSTLNKIIDSKYMSEKDRNGLKKIFKDVLKLSK